MMCRSFVYDLKCEMHGLRKYFPFAILPMIVTEALYLVSLALFGGPCKVALFYRIPGGGFTVGAYYVLWGIMFALFGLEIVLICTGRRHMRTGSLVLHHIAAHLCLILWYYLFFATLSQVLSLAVIIAAAAIFLTELGIAHRTSPVLGLLCALKMIVAAVYAYMNFVFLIIN